MYRTALLALAACISAPALAVGSLADINVIDRDTGQRLQAYPYKGEYWVAGRPEANYAIRIQNRSGERMMAVTSVDGVNVLSGETAGVNQTGYVFNGWQGYDIAGWRKSSDEIATFMFTSIPKSYAARTGRKENVGVIGVAIFRERYVPPPVGMVGSNASRLAQDQADNQELSEVTVAGARIQAPPAAGSGSAKAERAAPASAPSLGTGHGRREQSVVVDVPFERAQGTPNEVIRIRYDSYDNLVAMGVIPPAPKPRPLDPFPGTPRPHYVPDP